MSAAGTETLLRDIPRDPKLPHGHFSDGVSQAIENPVLQLRLKTVMGLLQMSRKRNIPLHSPADEIRTRGKLIRGEVIAHLDHYLSQFVQNAEARGIQVHLARTAADAQRIVLEIARKSGAKKVAKGKSMVSEEVELREAMEHDGMEVTETDLGELLVQLAGQPPSHIIAPAVHMTHDEMAKVLSVTVNGETLPPDPKILMSASRKWLRERFLEADFGITGANFGIAETGQFFIVTNEGNGRLSSNIPKVHVAMMGIERLLPNLASVPTILQLLTRCGTGQWITVYTTFFGGPRKKDELHGPMEQHIVLVDNGRSKLLGTEFAEALECIRCGACLNACPVYEKAGGHTYQSTYPGPIGKIVTPLYGHSPIVNELPHASSLCGACKEACPVKIDIPTMLIKLRRDFKFDGPLGFAPGLKLGIASRALASPMLYKLSARLGRFALGFLARDGWVRKGPGPLVDWTVNRDLPMLSKKPFRDRWRERQAKKTTPAQASGSKG